MIHKDLYDDTQQVEFDFKNSLYVVYVVHISSLIILQKIDELLFITSKNMNLPNFQ